MLCLAVTADRINNTMKKKSTKNWEKNIEVLLNRGGKQSNHPIQKLV